MRRYWYSRDMGKVELALPRADVAHLLGSSDRWRPQEGQEVFGLSSGGMPGSSLTANSAPSAGLPTSSPAFRLTRRAGGLRPDAGTVPCACGT